MTNTVTLPAAIVKRLERIAANSRHTPQSIIKQAITEKLDYEEWALAQVDAGIADVEAGRVHSYAEVVARMERKIGASRGRKKNGLISLFVPSGI
ncbi:MAG: hypothetical protein PHQ60_08545 [Sideroxydans sp.]|nr:hypothetical protein [Sideroxydans sp.]